MPYIRLGSHLSAVVCQLSVTALKWDLALIQMCVVPHSSGFYTSAYHTQMGYGHVNAIYRIKRAFSPWGRVQVNISTQTGDTAAVWQYILMRDICLQ